MTQPDTSYSKRNLKMRSKVTILSGQKTDGRHNVGIMIGIEMTQANYTLAYHNAAEFFARFTRPRFKVAYIDCVTDRACAEWFEQEELR